MRMFKVLLIGIIVSVFLVGQAYSAPKGNNGKANNGKAQAAKANKGNNKAVSQTKGQAAVHKQQARRSKEVNQKREARNRSADRIPSLNNGKSDLAFNNRDARPDHAKRHDAKIKEDKVSHGRNLIDSLNRARWSHNPHDTRGQGNMGKVDMLDPFGHDKDSDRKELYGNNGRPIREKESEEPLPDDPTSLLNFDFSLVGAEQEEWIWNWFQSVVGRYDTNEWAQLYYTYEEYYSMWEHHFYPGGTGDSVTGIRMGYNDELDYTISADGLSGESLQVTTTLVASEDFSGYTYTYNAETGSWTREYINVSAGDVVSETTQEVFLDPETGMYMVSAEIEDDAVPSQQNLAYFVDMNVTVTDSTTGTTTTSTYDKSLYLYRCPYGKITNGQTRQAIVNAKVTVHFEDGSIVSLDKATNKTASNPQVTDATGRFGFILQSNRKYYMTAKAEGYEDYKSEIFTEQWHVLREDITMEPKLEQIASNME